MNTLCVKCRQQAVSQDYLSCGHILCKNCLPVSIFTQQYSVSCPVCSAMSILHNGIQNLDVNPDNYVVCIECKSEVMSAKKFLSSIHRSHNVVTVANIIHDVQKSLRRYQLSFDLQNQALYNQIDSLSKQKRNITQKYTNNCVEIREAFQQLKSIIAHTEQSCLETYQKHAIDIISSYDIKIKQIKSEIFKCQSYIQSIEHTLITSNASKHIASAQFYFLNVGVIQNSLSKLINERKQSCKEAYYFIELKNTNLKQIKQITSKFYLISDNIWQKQPQPIKQSKKNPQNQIQQYFEIKRKQIFNINNQNKQYNYITINQSHHKNNSQINEQKMNKIQYETRQSYNIEGRIQNLRKTLKLVDNKNMNKNNLLSSFKIK